MPLKTQLSNTLTQQAGMPSGMPSGTPYGMQSGMPPGKASRVMASRAMQKVVPKDKFDLIPAILSIAQVCVFFYILFGKWVPEKEVPVDFNSMLLSVGLSVATLGYHIKKRRSLKGYPGVHLVTSSIGLFMTALLCGLSFAYPQKDCCCKTGGKADVERVKKGTC